MSIFTLLWLTGHKKHKFLSSFTSISFSIFQDQWNFESCPITTKRCRSWTEEGPTAARLGGIMDRSGKVCVFFRCRLGSKGWESSTIIVKTLYLSVFMPQSVLNAFQILCPVSMCFKYYVQYWLIFKDFQALCLVWVDCQGLSSTVPSFHWFVRTSEVPLGAFKTQQHSSTFMQEWPHCIHNFFLAHTINSEQFVFSKCTHTILTLALISPVCSISRWSPAWVWNFSSRFPCCRARTLTWQRTRRCEDNTSITSLIPLQ